MVIANYVFDNYMIMVNNCENTFQTTRKTEIFQKCSNVIKYKSLGLVKGNKKYQL